MKLESLLVCSDERILRVLGRVLDELEIEVEHCVSANRVVRMRRDKWLQRSLLYLAAGFAFSVAHIALRAVTPYAIWDQKQHQWAWAYGMQTLIFSKSPGLRFEPYFSTTSWTTLPEPLFRFC
jgi:hypothetical protein